MLETTNENTNKLGIQVVEALRKNHFEAVFYKTGEEAIQYILPLIPQNSTIGFGGSVTLQQLDLISELENKNLEILNHNKPGLTPEEALEIRRRQLVCDVFLTSTNAITQDGKLVNTDGTGNRVASMIFGPKTILIIAGINKIVPSIDAAYERIETIAAPQNNIRLNLPNPCTKTGKCMNCASPKRICNVTTVLHKKPSLSNIHVIIIGEELGY